MRVHQILFLASLFLIVSCSAPNAQSPEIGSQAPDFSLFDLNDSEVSLSDFRGQIVLLNFWATWCGPCRVEMPTIQERYNDGGFAVLAINFNESTEQVLSFANDLKLSLPILLDPAGKIQELYRVRGYPSSYFVDAEGTIRFIHIGEMNKQALDNYLTQIDVEQ